MAWSMGLLGAAGGGGVAGDFELLETEILASDTTSVTFDNLDTIASEYKHLQVRIVARTDRDAPAGGLEVTFNGDTTNSYAYHQIFADGSGVGAFRGTGDPNIAFAVRAAGAPAPTNEYGGAVLDILDFSSASKNTTTRSLGGNAGGAVALNSGGYFKTDAITSITFTPTQGTNIIANSRLSLYGIKAA